MKYKSCHLIEHGISIDIQAVQACCLLRDFDKGMLPILDYYSDNKIDWDRLFETKRKQRQFQQTQDIEDCKGCYCLREDEWDDKDYISYINFNHWSECNSRCVYCSVNTTRPKTKNKILPAIKELIKRGQFRNTGEITFQGGEPTIMKEFEQLIKLFIQQGSQIRIHSSGILFSRAIRNGLKTGDVQVVISPDSGCRETYKKIKRVDKFKNVWDNIKHYRRNLKDEYKALVRVKYIILPGYNDSIEEVDEFFKKIIEADIKSIIVDVECIYRDTNKEKISPHIYMLMDYFENCAKKNNIAIDWYDSARYINNSRTYEHMETLDKELFEKYKNENIESNIQYNY